MKEEEEKELLRSDAHVRWKEFNKGDIVEGK